MLEHRFCMGEPGLIPSTGWSHEHCWSDALHPQHQAGNNPYSTIGCGPQGIQSKRAFFSTLPLLTQKTDNFTVLEPGVFPQGGRHHGHPPRQAGRQQSLQVQQEGALSCSLRDLLTFVF